MARAFAVSPSTTNQGLFNVEITTAIFCFAAAWSSASVEVFVARNAIVSAMAQRILLRLVFMVWLDCGYCYKTLRTAASQPVCNRSVSAAFMRGRKTFFGCGSLAKSTSDLQRPKPSRPFIAAPQAELSATSATLISVHV